MPQISWTEHWREILLLLVRWLQRKVLFHFKFTDINIDQWCQVSSVTVLILVWNLYGFIVSFLLLLKIYPMWPTCYLSISNKFQIWLYIRYVSWPLPFCDLLGWSAWGLHNIHTCPHCVTRHFLQLLFKPVLDSLLYLSIPRVPL
jgi:hypothetical protein